MKSKKYMRILINCLTVLGISCAAIGYLLGVMVSETIQSPTSIGVDIVFMVIITVLLYLFMKKDNCLVKKHGIILVAIYIAYMAYTIIR